MQSTSSEPPADTTIIRTGRDGRLRYSVAQRQQLLDAFARSGLSAMAFSRHHGVSYQTFIAWLRKQRIAGETLPSGPPAFAEVMIHEPVAPQAAGLRIVLPCGTALELTSRAVLPLALELLQSLRSPC